MECKECKAKLASTTKETPWRCPSCKEWWIYDFGRNRYIPQEPNCEFCEDTGYVEIGEFDNVRLIKCSNCQNL